jgi:hypothetical protein
MGYDGEEDGPFGHPLGGYDIKLMAEQLAATMETIMGLQLEVQTLKSQIDGMTLVGPSNVVQFQPRNRRNDG